MIKFQLDTTQWNKLLNSLTSQIKDIMPKVGNEIVNYSQQCFDKKSWDGNAWPNKYNTDHLLVGSGNLRRSVRLEKYDLLSATVISDTPYSEIHNSGGKIEDNGNMVSFAWAKYYQTQEEKWKWTALKIKKDGYIEIEATKFLGNDSNELNEKIANFVVQQINKIK